VPLHLLLAIPSCFWNRLVWKRDSIMKPKTKVHAPKREKVHEASISGVRCGNIYRNILEQNETNPQLQPDQNVSFTNFYIEIDQYFLW
jgi:hypothetical protein